MTRPETRLLAPVPDDTAGIAPPLHRSVTFAREARYGRTHSPTAAAAEAILGSLEDAEAVACASGMSAWTVLCHAVLGAGSVLVLPDAGYYETRVHAAKVLEPFGVTVRSYRAGDVADLAACAAGARLVLVETPANPLMQVTDIAAAAAACRAAGALLACDNTLASPLLQQPLALGADVSWQSATKLLGGHHDLTAGVLTTRDGTLADRLRDVRKVLGAILAPDPAWLLVRGLRTAAVRIDRQVATAGELARRLHEHPRVVAVHHRLGPVLSFELPDAATADAVVAALLLVHGATSFGGVESLIERRAAIEPPGRVPAGLLRLSVGLEHVDDLWADLDGALAAATP